MKRYGQFCGLARALEHVGDRWTLLVIRELLLAPSTYGDLLAALDGIPTNLLADRLRQLEGDGVVARETDPEDRRRATYRLTPLGQGLEPALLALIRWGAHWMRTGRGNDRFEPGWTLLALRALLQDRRTTVTGTVELRIVDGSALTVASTSEGAIRVERGGAAAPDVIVEGPAELLLGLVSGELTPKEATRRGVRVHGDRT
ncbi:MAG: helix-turn-helix transcriptional regulator, partial [Actinomycetota bacterium]|nr:helix-turn-helix transcriptional regulator [Actinomycetota bacterium]